MKHFIFFCILYDSYQLGIKLGDEQACMWRLMTLGKNRNLYGCLEVLTVCNKEVLLCSVIKVYSSSGSSVPLTLCVTVSVNQLWESRIQQWFRKDCCCRGRLAKPLTHVQNLKKVWVRLSTPKPQVWFVCSWHSPWGRGTWWPLAVGSAAVGQDEVEQQLQRCLLFMCDQSLKVLLLLLQCKHSKCCLLEGETFKTWPKQGLKQNWIPRIGFWEVCTF